MTDFSLTELNDKISKESAFVKQLMDEIGKVIVCLLYTSDAADE